MRAAVIALLGRIQIHCEFRYERRSADGAYSGSEACWSDNWR
jgi:hypothetical protein